MPGTREIKRRIRSIKSTKKITRAMQMVSAVKMRKAQGAAFASRTYSALAWEIISNLADKVDPKYNALLQNNLEQSAKSNSKKTEKKVGVILVSSNRGLIGGFNANLVTAARGFIEDQKNMDLLADIVVVGKKGREAMLRMHQNIVSDFPKQERTVSIQEILPISKVVVDEYLKGNYSKVVIIYTQFVSIINQKAVLKQLLPFAPNANNKFSGKSESAKKSQYEYLFEPNLD